MNNIYANEIIEVKDQKGEIIYPWQQELETEVEKAEKENEKE